MRYVIIAFLAFLACTDNPPQGCTEPLYMPLVIEAGSQWVSWIRLESDNQGQMIWVGSMPFTVKVEVGDSLTAHFTVDVSNFATNYPQCNCEVDGNYHDCHEPHIATSGDGVWRVAE